MFQKINKMLDSHFEPANIPPPLKTLSAADWNFAAFFSGNFFSRLKTETSRPTRTDGSVTRDFEWIQQLLRLWCSERVSNILGSSNRPQHVRDDRVVQSFL